MSPWGRGIYPVLAGCDGGERAYAAKRASRKEKSRASVGVASTALAAVGLVASLSLVPILRAVDSPVSAAAIEYVTNPSVETALAPWTSAYNTSSRVERTTGGYDGTYAVRATNTQSVSHDVGFRDKPSQVTGTVAGQAYDRQLTRCAHTAVPSAGHGLAPRRTLLRRQGHRQQPVLHRVRHRHESQPG